MTPINLGRIAPSVTITQPIVWEIELTNESRVWVVESSLLVALRHVDPSAVRLVRRHGPALNIKLIGAPHE